MTEFLLAFLQGVLVIQTTVHGTILTLFVLILYALSDLLLDTPTFTLIIPIIAFVYAGAIIVLFVFCLTLLSPSINPTDEVKNSSIWYIAVVTITFILALIYGRFLEGLSVNPQFSEIIVILPSALTGQEFIWAFFCSGSTSFFCKHINNITHSVYSYMFIPKE